MKKSYIFLLLLALSSCKKASDQEVKAKPQALAPLEIDKYDYDSFTLKGVDYKLPIKYKDLSKNNLTLTKDQLDEDTIDKNQQIMTSLSGEGYNIGVTFKNISDLPIDTKEATVIEAYINSNDNLNKDFRIANLSWDQALISPRNLKKASR